MVKRCQWGTCNSDTRYPERLEGGVRFLPFPKPKRRLEKCQRWIKACGRPHHQLNTSIVDGNYHLFVCTKHFVGGQGPTEEYPDPIQADATVAKGHRRTALHNNYAKRKVLEETKPLCMTGVPVLNVVRPITALDNSLPIVTAVSSNLVVTNLVESAPKAQPTWISPVDMLALTAENEELKRTVENQRVALEKQREVLENHQKTIETLSNEVYNKNIEITALKIKEDPDQCSATETDLRNTIDSLQHEIYKKDLEILNRDAEIAVLKMKQEPT